MCLHLRSNHCRVDAGSGLRPKHRGSSGLTFAAGVALLVLLPCQTAWPQEHRPTERRIERARAFLAAGLHARALAELDAAYRQWRDPETAALRAFCLTRLDRWDEALEQAEADYRSFPGAPPLLRALASLRWRAGRRSAAVAAARECLDKAGFSAELVWILARDACMAGYLDEAAKKLRWGTINDSNDPVLAAGWFQMDWVMRPRRNLIDRLARYEEVIRGSAVKQFDPVPYRFWIEACGEAEPYTVNGQEKSGAVHAALRGLFPILSILGPGGKRYRALLDTGSMSTQINTELVGPFHAKVGPEYVTMGLAGLIPSKAALLPRLQLGRMTVERVPISVAKMPKHREPHDDFDMILGSELLLGAGLMVTMDIDAGQVFFSPPRSKPLQETGVAVSPILVTIQGAAYIPLKTMKRERLGLALLDTGYGGVTYSPRVLERLGKIHPANTDPIRGLGSKGLQTVHGQIWEAENILFICAGVRCQTRLAQAADFVPRFRFTDLGFEAAAFVGYPYFAALFHRIEIDLPGRQLRCWPRESRAPSDRTPRPPQ